MFANTKLFSLVFLAASAFGAATSATDSADAAAATMGITTCIIGCSTQAAETEGCSSFADLQCVCTNANFQAAARECLTANCTAAELTSALALQDQECASISGAISASGASETGSSTSAGTASHSSATSAESAPASSSTNAASSQSHSSGNTSGSSSAPAASGSSTAPASSNTAGSSSGSSAAASATTSSSAATALRLSFDGIRGLAMAIAGVLAGAAFVL
ncbi:hypothetical protein EIP86_005433 [Pleurotus ostreatoroseus]|nr:hypothetical protein EIP86_005433 [Pleurotus ostreatoroseus]